MKHRKALVSEEELLEYEYKRLCQFACAVAHRMLYTSVLSICTTSLQGHTKSFGKKNCGLP